MPPQQPTRPLEGSYREIIDGILEAVYWHFKQGREAGTLEQLITSLHERVRRQARKKPPWTTLIMIDSQAVKNTCNASVETKGFGFDKATNGIKRQLAVDS